MVWLRIWVVDITAVGPSETSTANVKLALPQPFLCNDVGSLQVVKAIRFTGREVAHGCAFARVALPSSYVTSTGKGFEMGEGKA
eukprot:4187172-Alexandrium_andersonii.AAC.1